MFAACLAIVAMAGASAAAETDQGALSRHAFSEALMGTEARIVVFARDATQAQRAADAGFARIRQLDAVLSDYRSDSELSRLCARAGQEPVRVGPDLFTVLQSAQSMAERSGGAFDVTRGAVTRIWRQARKLDELPDPARIRRALSMGSYRDLKLDTSEYTVFFGKPGMRLDVGGIAKGYAAEQALQAVRGVGARRALVALGGDIAVGAPPPGEAGWRIDVAPLDAPGAPPGPTLVLADAAVSTAGDAEQWMEVGGVRYSHVLDARTGWPLTFRSTTTVVARSGLQADGLDTAASVLGAEAGLELVNGMPGSAVLMVRQDPDGGVRRLASKNWPSPTPDNVATTMETSR